jgi:hypothetical protein
VGKPRKHDARKKSFLKIITSDNMGKMDKWSFVHIGRERGKRLWELVAGETYFLSSIHTE